MSIFLSTAYLAPIEYYSKFLVSDKIYIEKHENYQKQSYRNRCTILSANGKMPLSVPVVHSSALKCLTRDIRIADHGNWQHVHWNALVSAYNSTPFFEYYQDDFRPFYEKKYDFLFDFNEELQNLVLDLLDIDDVNIGYTDFYRKELDGADSDFRDTIHPKKDWQQLDNEFISVPYYQVFEDRFGFTPNLSIADLLFNMGNESQIILRQSI
ncbi:WbqC family protein [Dysgonomonas sp. 520]|uniref:WbqC family protein n=1 Tax=Dysgonomonas sp. 520 TaxID=2302931 RepID=UPI0013D5C085|nr:WbqC family protein [Dysgonomonas sp. 520]NDW10843.1 hypothetical protein [Dysgonomonas sp. 520]